MIELLQHIVDGLSLGAIYALIALGYTMVYGVLKLINFAHGDVFMLGGLLLGLAEQLVAGYWSSSWRDAVAFAMLIIILLVKPSGILGRSDAEKV